MLTIVVLSSVIANLLWIASKSGLLSVEFYIASSLVCMRLYTLWLYYLYDDGAFAEAVQSGGSVSVGKVNATS